MYVFITMERCVIHIREGGETKGPFTKFIKNKCGENQSWEKILHSIHRWKSIPPIIKSSMKFH